MFPLEKSLIVTASREDSVGLEHAVGDELGVTTVRPRLSSLSAGVAEDTDIAPVITSDDEGSVLVSTHRVDVRTIGTSGEDTINVPGELNGLGGPRHGGGVGSAGGVLGQAAVFTDVPEKEFVSLAGRSEPLAVTRPIHSLDGGRVLSTGSTAAPVGGVVDADLVVVRSNSKEFATGGHGHNLNPLLGLLEFLGSTIGAVNVDDTIVGSNNGLTVRSNGDSARALGSGLAGDAGSTSLLGLSRARRDSEFLLAFACLMVPDNDLVVISGSDDAVGVHVSKTPDFTVVVRLHNGFLFFGLGAAKLNASVTGSDEHLSIAVIDSTDHGAESHGLLGSHGGAVPAHDVTVFASSEEHVVDTTDG